MPNWSSMWLSILPHARFFFAPRWTQWLNQFDWDTLLLWSTFILLNDIPVLSTSFSFIPSSSLYPSTTIFPPFSFIIDFIHSSSHLVFIIHTPSPISSFFVSSCSLFSFFLFIHHHSFHHSCITLYFSYIYHKIPLFAGVKQLWPPES